MEQLCRDISRSDRDHAATAIMRLGITPPLPAATAGRNQVGAGTYAISSRYHRGGLVGQIHPTPNLPRGRAIAVR